jgi:hypothetical protein
MLALPLSTDAARVAQPLLKILLRLRTTATRAARHPSPRNTRMTNEDFVVGKGFWFGDVAVAVAVADAQLVLLLDIGVCTTRDIDIDEKS